MIFHCPSKSNHSYTASDRMDSHGHPRSATEPLARSEVHDIPEDTLMSDAPSISSSALEVDSTPSTRDISDADSFVSNLSSTNSATSSIYDFVEEHGRTYHRYKQGKYVLPNDIEEQNRLDLQHQMALKVLEGRLHLAPIGNTVKNVLDVATGTGIWAIEFAQQYPDASVTGTDLSPIQPEFVPDNCRFEIDDAEDEWVYSKQFDYIHIRFVMTCFPDPKIVIEHAFKACAPGGYLEIMDGVFPLHCHDNSLEGTILDSWAKSCHEAGSKMGRPWNNAPNYKKWMEEVGFVDVKERVIEIPTNPWAKGRRAKELGMWFNADLQEALSASRALYIKVLEWAPEKVDTFLKEVKIDLMKREIHAYMPWNRLRRGRRMIRNLRFVYG
ncbi:S-adenosyl-L-methionine-dependent methyltransferase [Stipitochalara longipes BDJ]|nr:S-adenosyl-L-methionine-dependent methyltransferase [Stipitochalara longipes BDJ]